MLHAFRRVRRDRAVGAARSWRRGNLERRGRRRADEPSGRLQDACADRSSPIDAEPRADVVILDTHRRAGHDLSDRHGRRSSAAASSTTGGHNILEPAVYGKPIVFGPHMDNFAEISAAFLSNAAAVQVKGPRELDDALVSLMTDPIRRARLGAAARALVEANRGAKDKSLDVLAALLPRDQSTTFVLSPSNVTPRSRPPLLDLLYAQVGRARRRWYERHPDGRRRLAASRHQRRQPERRRHGEDAARRRASCGCLIDRGEAPADPQPRLRPHRSSRRRRRRVGRRAMCWPSSRPCRRRAADARAQTARRASSSCARIGIWRARSRSGALGATVHVLDDGFQHVRLARDLDILMTRPGESRDGRVLPFGRLRESPDAAARAHFVVVLDADRAAARTEAWALGVSGCRRCAAACCRPMHPAATRRCVAVAGIGHPAQFFEMLSEAGYDVARTMVFADHHPYAGAGRRAHRRRRPRRPAPARWSRPRRTGAARRRSDRCRLPASRCRWRSRSTAGTRWNRRSTRRSRGRGSRCEETDRISPRGFRPRRIAAHAAPPGATARGAARPDVLRRRSRASARRAHQPGAVLPEAVAARASPRSRGACSPTSAGCSSRC